MAQLHKNFTDAQVKEMLDKYDNAGVDRSYVEEVLGIKTRQFWTLLKRYRSNPKKFSIQHKRKCTPNKISVATERLITQQLKIDKKLIKDKNVPIRDYNYSYIKDELEKKHGEKVSVPTIINRAKKGNFYLKKSKPKKYMIEVF